MPLIDSTMIGSKNHNCIIFHSRFFYGIQNTANIPIQFLQFRIISRGIMPFFMTNMIWIVKTNSQ